MKSIIVLFTLITSVSSVLSQPNCNVFLWQGDTLQYKACKLSEKFNDYYQFDMKGIAILDSCLAICPYYADAHYEYGVVYLKAGNFIGWDKHINLAVKYDALGYLGLRASCRGKFFGDYVGAIHDIDSLDALVDYDIGFVHDGAYHLDAYKALCYKAIGQNEKAIELFEKHIVNNSEYVGLYDYLHLGVAYQKMKNDKKALEYFSLQKGNYDLAENNYYAAASYLKIGDIVKFNHHINRAEDMVRSGQKMTDGFHIMEDEVFLSDVLNLKSTAQSMRR